MSNSDDEFEEQLRQEAAEQTRLSDLKDGKLKVDPDGTVYDWDKEKKAWFPRIDDDFLARYQMSYGADVGSGTTCSSEAPTPGSSLSEINDAKNVPPVPDVNDPRYAEWYYKHYGESDEGLTIPPDTNSKEYRDWYYYYYGESSTTELMTNKTGKEEDHDLKNKETESSSENQEKCTPNDDYSDYYAYYFKHYSQETELEKGDKKNEKQQNVPKLNPDSEEYWNQLYHQKIEDPPKDTEASVASDVKNGVKGKKRKAPAPPPEPPKWFEIEETKNTNVYVTGLPDTMTDEQFNELMSKYGLIMFDGHTKKPKIKLYKDKDGRNKGDGRCCYIKSESVDLALQLLDGSDFDGNKITVERAKFELKGAYDPSKKKKKLSNNQKKKMKERQEKLFDWRPDKPRGARSRHERVVIVKNFFNPLDFDKNPSLINEIRQDLRDECQKYGEVTKVMVFDRHPDGIASANFKTPEEADVCIESLHGRYFACRQIIAETWDGKSKYEVKETEEQEAKRLKEWENFLDDDQKQSDKVGVDSLSEKSGNKNRDNKDSPGVEDQVVDREGAEASAAVTPHAGDGGSTSS